MGTVPIYAIFGVVFMLLFTVLQWKGKLPSIDSIQQLANVVNTKGGNILALAAFSLIFFFTGLGLIYWSLNRMLEGKLSADNAVLMMGLSWILGTAFGGSFSSMLKVMSGENPDPVGKVTEKTTVNKEVVTESPKPAEAEKQG